MSEASLEARRQAVVLRLFATRPALTQWLAKTIAGPRCEIRFSQECILLGESGQLRMQGVVLGQEPDARDCDRVVERAKGHWLLAVEVDPSVGYSQRVVDLVQNLRGHMR